ncbi:MAG: selenocysteine-specific translation elongation factor [Dethiosulfovibrio peptidovorans]|nr:MAG: selenocysteine-specific translation elongation factor [Dethiosulfovibrio peptidovorans]
MNQEIALVIGTAGHIDHGKTSLVKALTGHDCDRLSEERKRGITIELGFAPLMLPSQRVVSVVDVPGHERFIRQMVAGASGLDAVILVVAADEGVMPQTREHLDIIKLLGVHEGFVVLTKSDLVDDEMLELATADVEDLVSGTFLEGCPMIPASSTTGRGVDDILRELEKLVDRVVPRERAGAFFMPVDRAFPVAGFGTVVTGTAYRGALDQGANVEILPSGLNSRVRSVQVHGSSVDEAQAGQRVAMSLSALSVDQLSRGDVVCASGVFRSSTCLDVSLSLLPHAPEPVKHWQRLRVHVGTSDILARVAFLDRKELEPGDVSPAQLVLEEPVVVTVTQRFVIRFYSPLRTIGGGEVLAPYGRKARGSQARVQAVRRLKRLASVRSRSERVEALLAFWGRMTLDDLIVQAQETRKGLVALLSENSAISVLPVGNGVALSADEIQRLSGEIVGFVQTYHEEHPRQDGPPPDIVVNHLFPEGDRKLGRACLDRMVQRGELVSREGVLALPDFEPRDDQALQIALDALLVLCDETGFQPPLLADCPALLNMVPNDFSKLLSEARNMGLVSVVDGTFLLSSSVEARLMEVLRSVEGGITIASVRDITGSSRKFVLPLLEYLDGKGLTRRVGDRRIILGGTA